MDLNLATQREAAARYGVSPRTIRNWIAAGKATGYRLPGGHLRMDLNELDARLTIVTPRNGTDAPR